MAVEIGSEAPDFTLRNENGEEVSLSSLRGRNVVLIFFPAAFSGICTKELHTTTDLAAQYDAAGADVYGNLCRQPLCAEGVEARRGTGGQFLVRLPSEGCRCRRATTLTSRKPAVATRATYVIDKDGTVAHKTVNHPGEQRDQDAIIEALAACPV